jgi:hypothetical protein
MAIAKVLDIGFRTYVRYEAGERDAPVSILVKFARLGNLSLDRLLTTGITLDDLKIADEDNPPATSAKLDVIGGSLEEGRIMFKGIKQDFLVCTRSQEKNLIEQFRKVDRATKEKFLVEAEWLLKKQRQRMQKTRIKKAIPRSLLKEKNVAILKKVTKTIKKITVKG